MPESKLSTTSPDTEPSFSALSDITNAPADAQIKHSDSIAYWDSIESTDNGMLGGYPHVSRVDIMGSRAFLVKCGISGAVKREQRAGGSAAKRDAGGEKKENVKEGGEKAEVKEEKRLKRVVDCGAG